MSVGESELSLANGVLYFPPSIWLFECVRVYYHSRIWKGLHWNKGSSVKHTEHSHSKRSFRGLSLKALVSWQVTSILFPFSLTQFLTIPHQKQWAEFLFLSFNVSFFLPCEKVVKQRQFTLSEVSVPVSHSHFPSELQGNWTFPWTSELWKILKHYRTWSRSFWSHGFQTKHITQWATVVAQFVKTQYAIQEIRFSPWVGKVPWRRKWKPTPVFLPGEFHRQRSLGGLQYMGSQRVKQDLATQSPPSPYNPEVGWAVIHFLILGLQTGIESKRKRQHIPVCRRGKYCVTVHLVCCLCPELPHEKCLRFYFHLFLLVGG